VWQGLHAPEITRFACAGRGTSYVSRSEPMRQLDGVTEDVTVRWKKVLYTFPPDSK